MEGYIIAIGAEPLHQHTAGSAEVLIGMDIRIPGRISVILHGDIAAEIEIFVGDQGVFHPGRNPIGDRNLDDRADGHDLAVAAAGRCNQSPPLPHIRSARIAAGSILNIHLEGAAASLQCRGSRPACILSQFHDGVIDAALSQILGLDA